MFITGGAPSDPEQTVLDTLVLQWYYCCIPRKIRELIRVLTKAGFCTRGGKPSDDVKAYQERDVAKALKLIEVRNEDE